MSRRQIVLILLLIVAIVVLAGLTYGSFGKLAGKLPFLPAPSAPSSGGSANKAVSVTTLADGGYFYSVNGTFVEAPVYQGDSLRAEFIIDEEPSRRRFLVIMTSRGGMMNVGTITGDLGGTNSTAWALTSTEELEKKIKEGAKGQLRFVYQKDYQLTPFDRQTVSLLSQIAQGQAITTDQFILVPVMVGVVE